MACPEAKYSLSPDDHDRLIRAAFQGRENAYSSPGHPPFRVGAALLTPDKAIVRGASPHRGRGATGAICAERTAIVKAVSDGHSSFLAIAIRLGPSDVPLPISPCGLCRQVLKEFCAPDMPVLMAPADYDARRGAGEEAGGTRRATLGELYPLSLFPAARALDVI
ncbi:cytidine deaminase-like protein [Daedalea quercina L-15889]|uniref:Cytidine deaminase-like protein n=1 Tax=Daedalea quercina L-15889 TaxID=1314783 RepID=A0A165PWF8_9APHY|nr:cytidine deaminase-like protein [Daedalea quercina L-15889]